MFQEKMRSQEKLQLVQYDLEQSTLLYTIFSKELVLYILESYLPLFNQYINALLARIVEFELQIQLSENGEELQLLVTDSL